MIITILDWSNDFLTCASTAMLCMGQIVFELPRIEEFYGAFGHLGI